MLNTFTIKNSISTIVYSSFVQKTYKLLTGFVCAFFIVIATAQAAETAQQKPNIFTVEMAPALCKLDFFNRGELKQCQGDYPITVKSLSVGTPETCQANLDYRLSPVQQSILHRVMPDKKMQDATWRQYGTCSGLTASEYFYTITSYTNQIKFPKELSTGNSYVIYKSRFVQQLLALNKGLTPNSIDLICQANASNQNFLTEVKICFDKKGGYADCPAKLNNCNKQFIIVGAYQ